MSRLLLAFGSALVVLLAVVLVAPVFINWNGYRPLVAAQMESVLGQQVRIDGRLDIGFLPRLRLEAQDVVLGDPDAPLATLEALAVTSHLFAPLSPEPVLESLTLRGLVASLSFDDQGRLRLAAEGVASSDEGAEIVGLDAAQLGIDRFVLDSARLRVTTRPGEAPLLLQDVDATGRAGSLTGPWTLEGVLASGGERYAWDVSTGEAGPNALRAKGRITALRPPTQRSLRAVFDATLGWQGASATRAPISVTGETVITANPPTRRADEDDPFAGLPWRAEANLVLDPSRLVLSDMRLRVGAEEDGAVFAGQGRYDWAGREAELVLSARQIDLDRLLAGGTEAPAVPRDVLTALLNQTVGQEDESADAPRITLGLDAEGVVLGGEIVRRVRLDAEREPGGGLNVGAFEADLPGAAALLLSGRAAAGAESFRGPLTARTLDPDALLRWATATEPAAAAGWAARPFAFGATLVITPATVVLDELTADLGSAGRLTGTVGFGLGESGRWALKLAGETVDADRAFSVDLGAALRATRRPFELDLDIDSLSFGGVSPVRAREVRLLVTGDDERILVDEVNAVLDGARLRASGEIARDGGDGTVDLSFEATDLANALRAARLAGLPAPILTALDTRATQLTPLRLSGAVVGAQDEAGQRTSLRLEGDLRGTRTVLRVQRFAPQDETSPVFAGFIDASAPDSATLFRQLGFAVGDVSDDPVDLAAFELSYEGGRDEGTFELAVEGFGARLDVVGEAREQDDAPFVEADVVVDVSDAPRLQAVLPSRYTVPAQGDTTLALQARLEAGPSSIVLDDLALGVGENRTAGRLELSAGETTPRLSGELTTTSLSAPWLLTALLGAVPGDDQATFQRPLLSLWQSVPLASSQASRRRLEVERRLAGGVEIEAESVDLGPLGQSGRGRVRVAWPGGTPQIDEINLRALGGRLTGRVAVEGEDSARRIDAALALDGARLGAQDPSAALRGDIDLSLAVQGEGRSPATLLRSLAGSGAATLSGLRLRDIDPRAYARAVQAMTERDDLIEEEVAEAFRDALLGGTVELDELVVPLRLADGTLTVDNVQATGDGLALAAQGSVNVTTLQPAFSLSLTPTDDTPRLGVPLADAVIDARPRVRFTQAAGSPDVFIDARSLLRAMESARIEREIDRLEDIEQEVLERERLSRTLRAQNRRERDAEAAAAEAQSDAVEPDAPALDEAAEPESTVAEPPRPAEVAPEPAPTPSQPSPAPARTTPAPAAPSSLGRALRDVMRP